MARYWIDNISSTTHCPYDHHPLKLIKYQRTGMPATTALTCDFCSGIFLQYISPEVAASQPDISDSYLNRKEKEKLKAAQRKAAEEKAKARAEEERKERERLRKIREEQERKKRELEAKKRAEQAALKAKKDDLIAQINSAFDYDYFSAESYFRANNTEELLSDAEFIQLQEDFIKRWFAQNTPTGEYPPDIEQRAAIGGTKNNIEVVARAGSGKTTTIVNRFRFLTEHCNVDASTMLLLAFNKKAAIELRDRIEKLLSTHQERATNMPHVMTFHALAYSIVHPKETLIYDDDEAGSRELSRTVQAIIDEKIRDVEWASKIRSVMLSHFKGNWEAIEAGGHNLTKEKQLLYRRSLPNQTLKGEYVKSYGEKAIANILFEHDVEYKYEKAFYLTDGTIYRPDFTITAPNKRQVIIEYFDLADNPEYDRQIQRKREYWASKNTPLIEVYQKDVAGNLDTLTTELLGFLKEDGVPYRNLTEEEIWEKLKDRAIDEFTKAIKSFIGRCRKKDLTASGLRALIRSYSSDLPTENTFLEIATDIYDEYLTTIQREQLEDFDGLMSRATICIEEGQTGFDKWDNRGDLKDLTFIMIDEYQDFSYLFDRFLDSIRSVCPRASVFCVGDDWQAINAFAGSDVQYFQQFTQRYANSHRYYLKTNYRSKKEIVSVGTNLMSQGKSGDLIKPAKQGNGTVRIGYLTEFSSAPVEQGIHGPDMLTPAVLRLVSSILNQDKRVVFLMRTNDRLPIGFTCRVDAVGTSQDRFLASIQSFFTPDKRKRITASTTHKYKGKEEDAVIILDALIGFYPLIHPAWVFQRVFGDTVEKLIEEEKRLFYVAVSRAKDDLYILTTKGDESPFISGLGNLSRLNWDEYAPVRTDEVSVKIEICNQKGFGAEPTIAIKELLKTNRFGWDPSRKTWYHYYPREGFDITTILDQVWVQTANHIVLIQYNEDNQPEDAYLFADGEIIQLRTN